MRVITYVPIGARAQVSFERHYVFGVVYAVLEYESCSLKSVSGPSLLLCNPLVHMDPIVVSYIEFRKYTDNRLFPRWMQSFLSLFDGPAFEVPLDLVSALDGTMSDLEGLVVSQRLSDLVTDELARMGVFNSIITEARQFLSAFTYEVEGDATEAFRKVSSDVPVDVALANAEKWFGNVSSIFSDDFICLLGKLGTFVSDFVLPAVAGHVIEDSSILNDVRPEVPWFFMPDILEVLEGFYKQSERAVFYAMAENVQRIAPAGMHLNALVSLQSADGEFGDDSDATGDDADDVMSGEPGSQGLAVRPSEDDVSVKRAVPHKFMPWDTTVTEDEAEPSNINDIDDSAGVEGEDDAEYAEYTEYGEAVEDDYAFHEELSDELVSPSDVERGINDGVISVNVHKTEVESTGGAWELEDVITFVALTHALFVSMASILIDVPEFRAYKARSSFDAWLYSAVRRCCRVCGIVPHIFRYIALNALILRPQLLGESVSMLMDNPALDIAENKREAIVDLLSHLRGELINRGRENMRRMNKPLAELCFAFALIVEHRRAGISNTPYVEDDILEAVADVALEPEVPLTNVQHWASKVGVTVTTDFEQMETAVVTHFEVVTGKHFTRSELTRFIDDLKKQNIGYSEALEDACFGVVSSLLDEFYKEVRPGGPNSAGILTVQTDRSVVEYTSQYLTDKVSDTSVKQALSAFWELLSTHYSSANVHVLDMFK